MSDQTEVIEHAIKTHPRQIRMEKQNVKDIVQQVKPYTQILSVIPTAGKYMLQTTLLPDSHDDLEDVRRIVAKKGAYLKFTAVSENAFIIIDRNVKYRTYNEMTALYAVPNLVWLFMFFMGWGKLSLLWMKLLLLTIYMYLN